MSKRNNFPPNRALHPGMTPVVKRNIKEYARHYAEDMINTLYDIATDENNYPRDRITAAESILNRGYGKPVDSTKIDEGIGSTVDVKKLTTAEILALIQDIPDTDLADPAPILQIEQENIEHINMLLDNANE